MPIVPGSRVVAGTWQKEKATPPPPTLDFFFIYPAFIIISRKTQANIIPKLDRHPPARTHTPLSHASKTKTTPSSPAVTTLSPVSPCTKPSTPPPSPSPRCPLHSFTRPASCARRSHRLTTPSMPHVVSSHVSRTNSTLTTLNSSCAPGRLLRTAKRRPASNTVTLPSTDPAASSVDTWPGPPPIAVVKLSVSMLSAAVCSAARICPPAATSAPVLLLPPRPGCALLASLGRLTMRMAPPAPPTATRAPLGSTATLYSPPSTSKRWSSPVRATVVWPLLSTRPLAAASPQTSHTYRLESSATVHSRLPSGVQAPAVTGAWCSQ
ncbi:hypothetical protein CH63R_07057 [Colletotrichum higginsianum IMI 349063]|uniref:Uncharacterized protein n=1 Tax=Colletotrichum higginsianum (strain IMI 349063) TaxID=759273 RepID=A0A1B7Y8E5_COLHI|nr:hypothetical protein CH63R_07057 [Colletotrichum higginsianum IMI 349063]OBR08292.1 hypothetical protein CH63R_07057 [Colletotrichum higginsianum IMI 349063]